MATIDQIVLKENNITTSYDVQVKGENISGAVAEATTATKLASDAGSASQPVYFSGGKPVACSYTINASVPSGAKFTDTTYSAATTSAAGLMSAADKTKLDGITASADSVSFTRNLTSGTKVGTITINGSATDLYCQTNTDTDTHWTTRIYAGASGTAANAAATNPYIKITDDNTYRNQIRLIGSGATTVTSDGSGNITISSTDTNTNTNTTYTLTKSGSTIYLNGSDGSKTSVTDSDTNTTYTVSSLHPTNFTSPAYVFTMGSSGYSGGGGYSTPAQVRAAMNVADGATAFSCVYGSNSNGYYFKFSDGTLICTKVVTTTNAFTAAWGVMYETPKLSLGNWAYTFNSMPLAVGNCYGTSGDGTSMGFLQGIAGTSSTAVGHTFVTRPVTSSSTTNKISVVGIGRW